MRIGLGPTPMLYFAVRSLGLDGGVMVTGSHNPPDYNGFKMMLGKASFWGKEIQDLGAPHGGRRRRHAARARVASSRCARPISSA